MMLPGVYRARVVRSDPGTRRCRLQVPAVFGQVVTGWAEPMVLDFPVPVPGEVVWVLFEAGDKDHPVFLPRRSQPLDGEETQILAKTGQYDLEWVERNDHLHDGTSPQPYSPTGHGH